MAERSRPSERDIKALVAEEIRSAINYDETELSAKRAKAMEYYRGEMNDTPAMPGRSQVVSRDVADAIGWMLPGVIRVFTASDRMAIYEPVQPRDEAGAQQATDYVEYLFWKENPGYRIMWDATHDSLLLANGIVKHWWDASEECEYSEHSGLTAEQIALLQMEQGVEITAQRQGEPQQVPNPETGEPVEVTTFNIKVKRVTRNGRLRIECIEPENFLLNREARSIGTDDPRFRFAAHREMLTRSDLIEMGFDKQVINNLPAYRETPFSEETLAREEEEVVGGFYDVGDHSTTLIEVFECYMKLDTDGDGVSELVRVYYAGSEGQGELLDWEVWDDDVPFTDIPCEPVPHRWDARSMADETTDIQRIKTVLSRQMLDNLYGTNIPMLEAEQNTVINPEMLLTPKFGGIVWRKPGSMATAPVRPIAIPFVADKVMNALEYFDGVTTKRTGISRATAALDAETLQNQSATAARDQQDASYSQTELVARNMAELGWKRVFKQILRLIVKHQDRPRVIRLRDQWVEMDPRHWNANMDVTINVGLGTGSRERDLQMLGIVAANQKEIIAMMGPANPVVKPDQFVGTMHKMVEAAGLKSPDQYFSKPSPEEMQAYQQEQANKPDPKVEIEKQKLEAEVAKGQAQIQLDQQKAASQMQMEQAKNEADIILQREKMQMEAEIKREQIAAEMQLKQAQLAAELELKRQLAMQEMAIKREAGFYKTDAMASARTSGVHVGGEPG